MDYPIQRERAIIPALTEALQKFRKESMKEINLSGIGMNLDALTMLWKQQPPNLSISFSYKDTTVFISENLISLECSHNTCVEA